MDINFAVLADYANVSSDGKLNVMGIFDRVFARQLPSRLPLMLLVVRLEADYAEMNSEHTIRVQLADPEGAAIFDINGTFTPRGGTPGRTGSVNHVIRLADLPLQRTGRHRVLVWIDGDLKREVELQVDEPPRQPPPLAEGGGEPTFH
jgi:hypothetical protein